MNQKDLPSESPPLSLELLRKAIPERLFIKDELRFFVSLFNALSMTLFSGYLAYTFIPLNIYYTPLWIFYAIINGTFATGLWVLGHECGHGTFSEKKWKNDLLGYIIHTSLLVPYFTWQHSHFVHHCRTNHLTDGEGHIPETIETEKGKKSMRLRDYLGIDAWAIRELLLIFTGGWHFYLLFGYTGAPKRGFTSHIFVPNKLFTSNKLHKWLASDFGIIMVLFLLYVWVQKTCFWEMFALYWAPYFFMNCWLVGYTWLHHIDEDIPHYDEDAWDWLKGALATMDRSYPDYLNALHFEIGSTHVLHHLFSSIPHYNAKEANREVKRILGAKYNFDHKKIWKSLWSVAKLGVVEKVDVGTWKFIKRWPFNSKNE